MMGGMLSQNILNLVDTAMVGTLGDSALAAVGSASFANFMAIAFMMGLSVGVQAMVARRTGEGRDSVTALPLNGGLLIALGLGIPWCIVLIVCTPSLFPLLNDDPAVAADAIPYLQARLAAAAAVGMNFAFRGFWNGVNRPSLYLRTLVLMSASNIFLNWVLIFGRLGAPELGVAGAGIGSALATWLGTAYYLYLGSRHARKAGFLRALPEIRLLGSLLRLAIPTGLQQTFFAAGFTALFWIVGQVGTAETAALTVLINVSLLAILPGVALGLSAASLVGQALGRKEPSDARKWGWEVTGIGMASLGCIGLPMLLFPEMVLSLFIHDSHTLELARLPLRLVGATIAFEGVGLVLMHSLMGAGATRMVMAVVIGMQWLVFLPVAWLLGPVLGLGLLPIWCANVSYRALQAITMAVLWRAGRWAHIKI